MGVRKGDWHDALAQHVERMLGDLAESEPRDGAQRHAVYLRAKGVSERLANLLLDFVRAVDRQWPAEAFGKQPHVIETKEVIGMVVRIQDGVNEPDVFPQKLQPQFGGRVDQQVALRSGDENRATVALVAGIGRTAHR